MKKICVSIVIISFLLINLGLAGAAAGRKEMLQRIYQLYGKKQYPEALKAVDEALKTLGRSNELLQLKYNTLVKLKNYDEALAFIDKEIKKTGESETLLSAKYNVLFLKGYLEEALQVAVKKDKIAEKKSPWNCIDIMHVYLRMGKKSDALDWLKEAVSRGFISYRLLQGKKYELLQQENRFYDIIETIKVSIGLGYPAKNFTVKLINGDDLTLEKLHGKVVLIYFWAYWCEPCRQEMPHLDKIYREFKAKGLEIIGINLDSNKTKMEAFIKQNSLEWKQSCSGKAWKDETVTRYGVNSLPSLWVVDKKGILRSFNTKGKELRDVISTLLSEQ
jgi:thiol-disulfide isomerase/thioredoxin